jgi:hypothetical protein
MKSSKVLCVGTYIYNKLKVEYLFDDALKDKMVRL